MMARLQTVEVGVTVFSQMREEVVVGHHGVAAVHLSH